MKPAGTILEQARREAHLLSDIGSVYGVQFAHYVLPLVTVPYLSRVLGPASWGLLAMAQAFALYGNLLIDYGFAFSATRQIATAANDAEIERTVAGVSGAKALLAAGFAAGSWCAFCFVPLFHANALLFWMAIGAEILKAALPSYYFYGIHRVAIASTLDVSARVAAAAGIFVLVHRPGDAWIVFALQAAGAGMACVIGHALILRRHALRAPKLAASIAMLREGGAMFLFRSSHNLYSLGNAFLLGLFAPVQAVGFYAGAEKISSAAVGLLSPVTTALYPRAAGMVKTSLRRAARVTRVSLIAMTGFAVLLTLVMWLGAGPIVRILLGGHFGPSAGVLQILSLRAPLVAWVNVLGFQWLLALELEKSFQKITLAALAMNVALAACFAPRYTFDGMAWAVVISQAAAAAGIYIVLQRRKLNPFAIASDASYA